VSEAAFNEKRRQPQGQRRPTPPAGEVPATFVGVNKGDRSALLHAMQRSRETYWRSQCAQWFSAVLTIKFPCSKPAIASFDCTLASKLRGAYEGEKS
jgi:hypothetical protein